VAALKVSESAVVPAFLNQSKGATNRYRQELLDL
jgi:hypothetical protein